MSTTARIGIKEEDGTIRSVYLHWDGHPSQAGKKLIKHYSDPARVKQLILYGNLSALREHIHPEIAVNVQPHSFQNPQDDVCIFYGRDRGNKNEEAMFTMFEKDYWNDTTEPYKYLFKDGDWYLDEIKICL